MSDKITFHEAGQEISKGKWISQLATGMQKEIDELKHRISELESKTPSDWLLENTLLREERDKLRAKLEAGIEIAEWWQGQTENPSEANDLADAVLTALKKK